MFLQLANTQKDTVQIFPLNLIPRRLAKGFPFRIPNTMPLPKDPPNLKPARLVKAAVDIKATLPIAYSIVIINYSLLMPILQPFQILMYQYHISLHHGFRNSQQLAGVLAGWGRHVTPPMNLGSPPVIAIAILLAHGHRPCAGDGKWWHVAPFDSKLC